VHWGVEMARKGGVPADRVLNAMPMSEMTRYLRRNTRLNRDETRKDGAQPYGINFFLL
jgi:hypothetical protein